MSRPESFGAADGASAYVAAEHRSERPRSRAALSGPRQEPGERSGGTVISCNAPYGLGGLGRHLAELTEAIAGSGASARVIAAPGGRDEHPRGAQIRELSVPRLERWAIRWTPARLDPGSRVKLASLGFDRAAAAALSRPPASLFAFNGHALRQLNRARSLGCREINLVSANCHMAHEAECFARAMRAYPLERPWALRNVRRNLAEYALAETVHVSSWHAWESFVQRGFPEERLRMFPLSADRRYVPLVRRPSETFNLLYVGSLAVHKGVGLLLDALKALPQRDIRLVLVGGWSTPGMRRFVQGRMASDGRICLRPGDPLPQLRNADLLVHPSYGDGFGYAPAEALACGVPVLVSDQTGMKQLIADDSQGHVFPSGSLSALIDAIAAAYRGDLFRAPARISVPKIEQAT